METMKWRMTTLHLLERILSEEECNAHKALQAQGLRTQALLNTLSRYRHRGASIEPALRKTMDRALEMAGDDHCDIQCSRAGTDHLLLALMANETSRGGYVLKQIGLDPAEIQETLRQMPREV